VVAGAQPSLAADDETFIAQDMPGHSRLPNVFWYLGSKNTPWCGSNVHNFTCGTFPSQMKQGTNFISSQGS